MKNMKFFLIIVVIILSPILLATQSSLSQNLRGGMSLSMIEPEGSPFDFSLLSSKVKVWPDGNADQVLEQSITNASSSTTSEITWIYDWPSGQYLNAHAWDDLGDLQISQVMNGTQLALTIYFRNPLPPGQSYHLYNSITVVDVAEETGSNWQAYWYIGVNFAAELIHSMTFPPDAILSSISPIPTNQNQNYVEWRRLNFSGTLSTYIDYTLVERPYLDWPVNYQRNQQDFARVVKGNTGKNPGMVNSWVDHQTPDYHKDGFLYRWDGCQKADPPLLLGDSSYDGHSGIDIQKQTPADPVYAAADGTIERIRLVQSTPKLGDISRLYGNYVLIRHGGGYATLYAHLASVAEGLGEGEPIYKHDLIGIMGNTGNDKNGIHLHFGVYYDADNDQIWEETGQYTEAVDPFGWDPRIGCPLTDDPLDIPNIYLWQYLNTEQQFVSSNGGTVTAPSEQIRADIPQGALDATVTIKLSDTPLIATPAEQLRSLGYPFEFRVLEWLPQTTEEAKALGLQTFNLPVTLTVNYEDSTLAHLSENEMALYQWNETSENWDVMPTTVNSQFNQASTETIEMGSFSLHAPLLCPSDVYEIDDDNDFAHPVELSVLQHKLFDISVDEDWSYIDFDHSGVYEFRTQNLFTGVDTILEIYGADGVNLIGVDDNGGGGSASQIIVEVYFSGRYYIRVKPQTGSLSGCDASYDLSVNQIGNLESVFLPLVASRQNIAQEQMAFVSNRDGDNEIYIANVNGSGLSQITNNIASDENPSWSPDGSQLVFHSNRDGYGQIYMMNADGSNQVRLLSSPYLDQWPFWSPAGDKIAFGRIANHGQGVNTEVYVMNTDGTNVIRLTYSSGQTGEHLHSCWPSGWSPDGSQILYYCYQDGYDQLWIMNADGSNQHKLLDDGHWNAIPTMSSDGTKIAFASFRDGNYEIYIMNTDGSNVSRLTFAPSEDWRPTWSINGSKILFESQRDNQVEVYSMNSNGSEQVNLSNSVQYDGQAIWRP